MSEKMVAIAPMGQEFMYRRSSAHSVPASSADIICKALNDARYKLQDGYTWHVYDCGWYERDYTNAGLQRFFRRKGRIYEGRA